MNEELVESIANGMFSDLDYPVSVESRTIYARETLEDMFKIGVVSFDLNDEALIEHLAIKDVRRSYRAVSWEDLPMDSQARHMESIRQMLRDICDYEVQ